MILAGQDHSPGPLPESCYKRMPAVSEIRKKLIHVDYLFYAKNINILQV